MDAYHKRFAEARLADDVRNKLIEDLLRKVDDMQKTMDRNTFSLVLIDGDGMNVSSLPLLDLSPVSTKPWRPLSRDLCVVSR